jgi:hypothetical protein
MSSFHIGASGQRELSTSVLCIEAVLDTKLSLEIEVDTNNAEESAETMSN